jgi:CRISPR-associated protein Cmr6
VKPSPVWIRDLGEYQVVTVFGADVDPRQKFLKKLRQDSQDYQ